MIEGQKERKEEEEIMYIKNDVCLLIVFVDKFVYFLLYLILNFRNIGLLLKLFDKVKIIFIFIVFF